MIKAAVIEDDYIWKTKLLALLDQLDITVVGVATDVKSALALLNKEQPNLLISDIMLGKERVFEIFDANPSLCKIPTIFLTQSETDIDYKNAKKVLNHLYVVKPVHKLTFRSAVETLCNSADKQTTATTGSILFKGKFNQKISLAFDKIIYIKQSQHYCSIYTAQQEFVLKKSLVNIMKELDARFMQVHRSYCINKDTVENFGIGLDNLKLNGIEIPIGLTYKERIKELIAKEYSVK